MLKTAKLCKKFQYHSNFFSKIANLIFWFFWIFTKKIQNPHNHKILLPEWSKAYFYTRERALDSWDAMLSISCHALVKVDDAYPFRSLECKVKFEEASSKPCKWRGRFNTLLQLKTIWHIVQPCNWFHLKALHLENILHT